jgi:hemoglobin
MYAKIFTDPELSDFFRMTDKEHQKEMQRLFLTYATGGSSTYTGKSMQSAHGGRGIGEREFNLVAHHVISTMDDLGVQTSLKDEVIALLVPLKPQIVEE